MPRIRGDSIEEHKLTTRAGLLEAAAAFFYERGYTDTSLVEIADTVGIGRTTLYEYFPSKEALMVAVIEDQAPRHVDHILEKLSSQEDTIDWLGGLFAMSLDMIAAHVELGRLVFHDAPQSGSHIEVLVAARLDEVDRRIIEVCKRGIAAGVLADGDPHRLARTVISTLRSAMAAVAHAPIPTVEAGHRKAVWWPLLRASVAAEPAG